MHYTFLHMYSTQRYVMTMEYIYAMFYHASAPYSEVTYLYIICDIIFCIYIVPCYQNVLHVPNIYIKYTICPLLSMLATHSRKLVL